MKTNVFLSRECHIHVQRCTWMIFDCLSTIRDLHSPCIGQQFCKIGLAVSRILKSKFFFSKVGQPTVVFLIIVVDYIFYSFCDKRKIKITYIELAQILAPFSAKITRYFYDSHCYDADVERG